MCVSFWLWIARALLSLMLMTLISGVAALSVAVWPADGVGDDYGGEHMTMTLLLAVSIFRWNSVNVWKIRDFEILQWNFEIVYAAERRLLLAFPRIGITGASAYVISL